MNEMNLLRSILLHCSRGASRLFRQNVGMAWTGKVEKPTRATQVTVFPGDVVIRQARPFKAGIEGMSDLTGWTQRDGVAVFTAIEVKTETGRVTPEQVAFLETVRRAGGIAGVARSVEDAGRLLGLSDER